MRVILIETGDTLLASMHETNRKKAVQYLNELGTEVWLNTKLTKYDGLNVTLGSGKPLQTSNLMWAAGVKGQVIEGINPDVVTPAKRMLVDEINRVKGYDNIFAIGDVGCMVMEKYPRGHPQVAPVAIQQGHHLAQNIARLMDKKPTKPFDYFDKGTMATVGRNKALVQVGKINFGGFFGWAAWLFVHLMSLVGFRNRVIILLNWVWNYLSYNSNIRLIIRPYKTDDNK
jgi:NADH dehydrogenase